MYPDIRIRQVYRPYFLRPTTFYPNYKLGYDYVSRVLPVQRVAFQRVLPRYYLSTSLTRDTGLGPFFEKIRKPSYIERLRKGIVVEKLSGTQYRVPLEKKHLGKTKGRYIDVFV